ncbi:sensor histidine kinase [Paenibacillus lupini]|uniref:sensor histidine kinase n=1 Tax=Paenibacillus lupini TaxID=1450204 RepID=UPI00141DA1D6|nr:sensor histidine kinase [Paenibacillus lupini]NIK21503.1 two-component system sensor histidine kinase YesM [Paenibacillus lupini]
MSKWGSRLRIWTEWPSTRMEAKLLIVFVLLILLPIALLTLLSAQRYTQTIESNTVSYASELTDKMISKLDDYTVDMKKISIIPSYLDEIQAGLKLSNDYYEKEHEVKGTLSNTSAADDTVKLKIQRKIESSIYFMNNIKEGTSNIYLFDRYGNPYYVIKSGGVRSNLSDYYGNWQQIAHEAHGKPVLVSTQEVTTVNRKQYVFTVVREIIDKSYNPIGLIAVDANISVITNIVQDLDATTHGTTLILDEQNSVIYDSEQKYLLQNLSDNELLKQVTGKEGSFHIGKKDQSQLVIYRKSEESGWLMLISIPEKQLMYEAMRTRNYTTAAAIFTMCLAFVISLITIFALTKPLRSLVKLMKQVQSGKLDVMFPIRRRDEVGMVGNAFNRMMGRIVSLIEDIYRIEQRKNQIELESLQRQINPHFIYNTLESIRMTAVINDDPEVGQMVQLLGQQLRYSIHAGSETVQAEQEWEHLRMYMQLLSYRYGTRYSLKLPEDSAVGKIEVMKLLFQPIVENAINHAYDEQTGDLVISIGYMQAGGDQYFVVKDEGSGMDETALLRLRSMLDAEQMPEWEGRGIGLRNVNERLKLRYGPAYGITVDSAIDEGTTVSIKLPITPKQGGITL